MARYIDADKLKERLEIISVVSDDLYGMGINRGLDRADAEIDMLPTADVVEVVRCKDCAVPHNKWTGCPHLNGLIPPPDFYCGFGERSEQ